MQEGEKEPEQERTRKSYRSSEASEVQVTFLSPNTTLDPKKTPFFLSSGTAAVCAVLQNLPGGRFLDVLEQALSVFEGGEGNPGRGKSRMLHQ